VDPEVDPEVELGLFVCCDCSFVVIVSVVHCCSKCIQGENELEQCCSCCSSCAAVHSSELLSLLTVKLSNTRHDYWPDTAAATIA
jgi:hypothetical protein